MTVPTSTNWTMTGTNVIDAALRKLGVIDPAQTTDSVMLATGAMALNGMLKAWQLDGIDIWLDREYVVYMSANSEYYDLGPSGDEAAELRESCMTQLANDAAANETEITVDSITGFANDDNVGVILDDGTIHWDTANGSPANTEITLTTGISGAASTDNYVFGYTTSLTRPIEITEARVRNTDNNDTPIKVVTSRDEFMRHYDKTSQGETQEVYYDPLTVNGRLYVWPVCGNNNITDRLILSGKKVVADIDDPANDNFDVPNEVLLGVIWCLAEELQVEYGLDIAKVTQQAVRYYTLIKSVYKQKRSIYLRP